MDVLSARHARGPPRASMACVHRLDVIGTRARDGRRNRLTSAVTARNRAGSERVRSGSDCRVAERCVGLRDASAAPSSSTSSTRPLRSSKPGLPACGLTSDPSVPRHDERHPEIGVLAQTRRTDAASGTGAHDDVVELGHGRTRWPVVVGILRAIAAATNPASCRASNRPTHSSSRRFSSLISANSSCISALSGA